MQSVTLGGDRLGSGKKQKVTLNGYERSTHDLGYLFRTTMAAGTLVPFMHELAVPGDTFDINLNVDVKTHPTIGPLFGSYKVQLDVFQCPIRLYVASLHNNELGIGLKTETVKLPILQLEALQYVAGQTTDYDNSQVNPSCILSYLGIRGAGYKPSGSSGTAIREFQCVSWLAYWDVYKNYYANKQEERGFVIHSGTTFTSATLGDFSVGGVLLAAKNGTDPLVPIPVSTGTEVIVYYTGANPNPKFIYIQVPDHYTITLDELLGGDGNWQYDPTTTPVSIRGFVQPDFDGWELKSYIYQNNPTQPVTNEPEMVAFPLENLDKMRRLILSANTPNVAFNVNNAVTLPGSEIWPYYGVLASTSGRPNRINTQEGLGLKTYQSDLLNNWLQTEWIDGSTGINAITAIDVSGGTLEINTLILARKIYDMLNRVAVSGGSYFDYLEATYDHQVYKQCSTPMYLGGLSKELAFQEVVSNGPTEEKPLGTLAGKGVMTDKHKGGHVIVKVDEPSYILGIISLTPRIDYSQGNSWDVSQVKTIADLHRPELDEIGFQELPTELMHWADTTWNGTEWVTRSAGKQPAWIHYMTNINRTRGNFAINGNEMYMTLNRQYYFEPEDGELVDVTTYIDPKKFNNIFAQTARDAQNFWTQIAVDITARRKMSAKVMPNL